MGDLVSDSPASHQAVTYVGAIAPLVALLGGSSEAMQEEGTSVLQNLAHSHAANQVATAATANAITSLVVLLASNNKAVQQQAAGALSKLARDPANQQAIPAAGAIPRLVVLLGSSSVRVQ